MTTYNVEKFDRFYDEALPLLEAHRVEVAAHLDIPLSVDVARYRALEVAGALRIFAARHEDQLVGYAVFITSPNAHYTSSLCAAQDVLYVDPAHRRGRVGLNLVRFAEAELRRLGVQVVTQHVKVAHPALGRLLEHENYTMVEHVYAKRLDR